MSGGRADERHEVADRGSTEHDAGAVFVYLTNLDLRQGREFGTGEGPRPATVTDQGESRPGTLSSRGTPPAAENQDR